MKTEHSLSHISQLKASNLIHAPQRAHINGQGSAAPLENLSDEDEEESGQEDEEEETVEAPRKWHGIEAIFEAFHEYVDGKSVSRHFGICI